MGYLITLRGKSYGTSIRRNRCAASRLTDHLSALHHSEGSTHPNEIFAQPRPPKNLVFKA